MAPPSDTSSQGCATATLMVLRPCAALTSRWYFSWCTPSGSVGKSGMLGLVLAPLRGLDFKQCLNPLEPAPTFVRHVPTSRSDLAQRLECRLALSEVCTEQLWQCRYGAFLIEADQQILLPKHFLELRQAHLLIERP